MGTDINIQGLELQPKSAPHKTISFEPPERQYQISIFQSDVSSSLFELSSVVNLETQEQLLLQKFDNIAGLDITEWIRRWNEIQELYKSSPQGVVHHHACHFVKDPAGGPATAYFVIENMETSLRNAKNHGFTFAEIVDVMYQVSEVVSTRSPNSKFNLSTNPDTILIKRDPTGKVVAKLSTFISGLIINGVVYDKRPEYAIYTTQVDSTHSNDVFALGISIMEVLGVSQSKLESFKTNRTSVTMPTNPNPCDLAVFLQAILLRAVDSRDYSRISAYDLQSKLKSVMKRSSELDDLSGASIVTAIENGSIITESNPRKPIDTERVVPIYTDSDQRKERFKKAAGSLIFLLLLFNIVVICVMLGVHFAGVQSGSQISGAINGLYNNVNTLPFVDIAFADAGTGCPAGFYNITSLGNWPGTVSFCYDFFWIDTRTSLSDCYNYYYSRDAHDYLFWNSKSICVKQVPAISNGTDCPASYTKCAPGLCVSGTECPITTLELSTTSRTDTGWTSVSSGDGRYFNYRKDVGSLPVINFELSMGTATPCISTVEFPTQVDYDAIRISSNGCKKYGQFPNSVTLDTSNGMNEFTTQPWSESALKLPGFSSTLSKNNAYLTVSPRLELAEPCYDLDLAALAKGGDLVETTRKITTGFSIAIAIIVLITLFVFLPVACEKKGTRLLDAYRACGIPSSIIYAILALLLVAATVASHYYDETVASYKSAAHSIMDRDCFTIESVNTILQDFVKAIVVSSKTSFLWKLYLAVHWCGSIFIWTLVYLVRRRSYS